MTRRFGDGCARSLQCDNPPEEQDKSHYEESWKIEAEGISALDGQRRDWNGRSQGMPANAEIDQVSKAVAAGMTDRSDDLCMLPVRRSPRADDRTGALYGLPYRSGQRHRES